MTDFAIGIVIIAFCVGAIWRLYWSWKLPRDVRWWAMGGSIVMIVLIGSAAFRLGRWLT